MRVHPGRQGRLLPHPLAPRERLRACASWCNAAEGNTTPELHDELRADLEPTYEPVTRSCGVVLFGRNR